MDPWGWRGWVDRGGGAHARTRRPLIHHTYFSSQQAEVSTGGGGPQVNKSEQVSSLGHKMSLAEGRVL